MSFPVVIAEFFQVDYATFGGKILRALNSGSWFHAEYPVYSIGMVVYIALIVVFAYFYTSITFNPLEVANNMKKSGGFIQASVQVKPTSDYLNNILNYIVFIGACGLIVVCLIPIMVSGIFLRRKPVFRRNIPYHYRRSCPLRQLKRLRHRCLFVIIEDF